MLPVVSRNWALYVEIDRELGLTKNPMVREGTSILAAITLVAASFGAPLLHLHESAPHEHEVREGNDPGGLLHAHAAHSLLHHHASDGVELAASDEEHSARYLDLFQVKTVSVPVLIFLLGESMQPHEPAVARATRTIVEFRNHDPPFADWFSERGPPA